jgi:hypothetical protein
MRVTRQNTFSIIDPNQKRVAEDFYKLTNKNISFGHQMMYVNNVLQGGNLDQNIDGVPVEITNTGTVNTQFSVTHNLGRIPLQYDVKYINGNGVVYDSGTTWTKTQIFLKCSLANAHIRLFIH